MITEAKCLKDVLLKSCLYVYIKYVSVAQWCLTLFIDILNRFNIFNRYYIYIYLTDIKYIYICIKYIYINISVYIKQLGLLVH